MPLDQSKSKKSRKNQNKSLSDKISLLVKEGYKQKQAVAIAHSMLDKKGK